MSANADHEAYIRAALRAAAESLEPRGDGLERIRGRLQHPRPVVVSWLLAAWDELRFRAPAAVQDAFYRVAAEVRMAWERFAPAQAPGRHRSRAQGWIRPLAAMAGVMFIVAAGTYVAIDVSTGVSPSSSSSHPHAGGPGGGGQPGGAGASQTPSGAGEGSGSAAHNPSASPTCTPKPKPSAQPSATVPASPSPSPSASPSASATPSPPDPSASAGPALVLNAIRLASATKLAASEMSNDTTLVCGSRTTSPATPAASPLFSP